MAKPSSKNLEIRGIEIIPGIGVIRVRCLRKAGFESIDSLANVTLEEIASIPGIGDAKARQIKEFVEQLAAAVDRPDVQKIAIPSNGADSAKKGDAVRRTPLASAGSARKVSATKRPPHSGADSASAIDTAKTDSRTDSAPPLTDAIKQLTQTASDLLRAPISQQFQPGLARQIGRIAAIAVDGEVTRKQTSRALTQTAKLAALLAGIADADDLPTRRQQKLSEELRDRRRKVNKAIS